MQIKSSILAFWQTHYMSGKSDSDYFIAIGIKLKHIKMSQSRTKIKEGSDRIKLSSYTNLRN